MTATELIEDFTRRFGGKEDDIQLYFTGTGLDLLGGFCAANGGNVLTASLSPGTYVAIRHTADKQVCLADADTNLMLTCSTDTLTRYREKNWGTPIFEMLAALQSAGTALSGMSILLHHSIQDPAFQQPTPTVTLAVSGSASPKEQMHFCTPRDQNPRSTVLSALVGRQSALLLVVPRDLEYSYLPFPVAEYKIILIRTEENIKKDFAASFSAAFHSLQEQNPTLTAISQITQSDVTLCQDAPLYPYVRFMFWEQQRIQSATQTLRSHHPDLQAFFDLLNTSGRELCALYKKHTKDAVSLYQAAVQSKLCAACRILDDGRGIFCIVQNDQVDTFLEKLRPAFVEKAGYPPAFYICDTADSGVRIPPPPKPPK